MMTGDASATPLLRVWLDAGAWAGGLKPACAARKVGASGQRRCVLVEKGGGCSGFQVVISWLTSRMEFRVFLLLSPGLPGILGILGLPLFGCLL